MDDKVLRIGELAARAGVSTRTVDFYTGLGLLTPVRRSGGNFRLYRPGDVQRIAAVRHLEAQGIRLDDIAHVLAADAGEDGDHGDCADRYQGPCPADPVALAGYLSALDVQVQALRDVAQAADPQTRGVLATLAARAQSLIATALLLSADVLPGGEAMPPF
jgi:MerR family transcriptional regulator, copper efflux regulator